ncbi:MAG: hypothetical protein AAF530_19045 [Pseudomonadota bacterium]
MFTVSGCVLPPAISVATLALDVGSFAVSGKTMTDHGISLVAQEDCALTRVLEGEICEAYLEYEVAGDVLTPLPAENFGMLAEDANAVFWDDRHVTGGSHEHGFEPPVQLVAAQAQVAYSFTVEPAVASDDLELAEVAADQPEPIQYVQLKTR